MSDARAPRGEGAGRWALIPGASTGTGAAAAVALARDAGLDVFGFHLGHHPDEAAGVESGIREAGRRVEMRVLDVGDADGVAAGADALLAAAGPCSVKLFVHAISGASIGHFLPADDDAGFHPRQVARTFDRIAHSFVYWAQALVERDLLAPEARLIGLTNPLYHQTLHNTGLIGASKAALAVYVRHLAIELGRLGHRVNLIEFGTVVTPALQQVLGPRGMAHMHEVHARIIPAGRVGTAEEVADLIVFLASERGSWFNGATIDFTGGMTLRLLDEVLKPG